MFKLGFITVAILLSITNCLSNVSSQLNYKKKDNGSLNSESNSGINHIYVDNFNEASEILNNKDSGEHHFSFVELSSTALKGFSYHRLLEELSDKTVQSEVDQDTDSMLTSPSDSKKNNVANSKTISRETENKIIFRNICIWVPIGLAIVLFFVVYLTAFMNIPKSTILYATYVTNKSDRIN